MKHNKRRKLKLPRALVKVGGLVTAEAIRAWMSTLDYRAAFYDRSVDPALGIGGPRIYIFWHENILAPLYLRGHCRLTMLLSQHNDADILARIAYHFGFDCVRGSTYRGGARAIWELFERSHRHHLTMTPDGPRGPRRKLAQGPVYLASRLQLPLVVMGFGYDRPWRATSWDRFAVPRPFSRARAVIGPPLMLPHDLTRAGLEQCRQRVENLLNGFTAEAEAWAAAGTRKAGEVVMTPQSARTPISGVNSSDASQWHVPSRAA
ncbi:MAG TPA: lysophospholipid acyltransferase family protein [Lacipirellulaceae bacterium]|nr:lysophospholipid acyltransferase family protein [Lacipirellulaceae bacterium]